MVNFKSFIFISFGIMFTSCCYKGTINEYNNIRKKMDFTVTTNNGKIYDIIDTTKIYINTGIYSRDTYYKSSESKYVEYLKFYANGKVGSFLKPNENSQEINREDLNPKKARMGYFDLKNNIIEAKWLVYNQCQSEVLKCIIEYSGDTLVLKYKNESLKHISETYIKTHISVKNIENWKPDW